MSILDEIKLPQSSQEEELEQTSKDKLRTILNNELFEIREELYRDKGIDLTIELKYNKSHTNFRFLVQLKATEVKKPNTDKTYSWQIDTSNIQYLLNGGLPAYYICYVKSTDTFYYKQLNNFIHEIIVKNPDWNSQDSHILRTSSILNKDTAMDIYEEVKNRCEKNREITEKLQLTKKNSQTAKISITSDYQITDETSIISLIENIGLVAINEGRSKEVVMLSEKTSSDITSSLYNLTVGIAHYYTSNLFDALGYFQKAKRQKSDLPENLAEYLDYFDAIVKYSTGYLNQQEYLEILDSLKSTKDLGYYIKIEDAKNKYSSSLDDDSFNSFRKEILDIINDINIKNNIKFIAQCEYLFLWGSKVNMDLFRSAALINAIENETGPNHELCINYAKEWLIKNQEWEKYYKEVNNAIIVANDHHAFNICKLNEAKIRFELLVYTSTLKSEKIISEIPPILDFDCSKITNTILLNLDKISKHYRNNYEIDNLLVALSTKYEVLQFLNKTEEATKTIAQMHELIEFHSLKDQKQKLEYLINGGTLQENFRKLLHDIIEKKKSDRIEFNSLIKEMEAIDEKEKTEEKEDTELLIVELFPIGHFSIPKNQVNEFYEILKIDSHKLIHHLEYFFNNGKTPVFNIFNNIEEEGYANGYYDDKGIISWRKIRNIRKELHNKKFKRVIIKLMK